MLGNSNSNRSVIRLKPGNPPLELSNTMQKARDSKTGVFSTERCTTYTLGKRHLSCIISEMGCTGHVNVVQINLIEENGKGASANLSMRIIRDDRYGVLCNTNTKLSGSYDSFKESYCVPPLSDAELLCYVCRDTGSGSCFSMTRKKVNAEFVEMVKVKHAFVVDDELTFNVRMKITNNKRIGLCVEVEGPVKLTLDYTKRLVSKIRGKMDTQMEACALFLFKNGMHQIQANHAGQDYDIDDVFL
ncbi:hypothetical protein HN51_004295 [Arachis hypogaea]|nr:uncharacterized protein DS421_4g114090 [Arachis hypogaea]